MLQFQSGKEVVTSTNGPAKVLESSGPFADRNAMIFAADYSESRSSKIAKMRSRVLYTEIERLTWYRSSTF